MHHIKEISVVFFKIWFLANVLLANVVIGFLTKKCDHHQIEAQFKGYFNCIYNMTEEKSKSAIKARNNDTIEWCNLLEKETNCFTQHLGTCLNEQITNDLEILYLFSSMQNGRIACTRVGNRNASTIRSKGSSLMKNYISDIQNVNEIATFDKGCSTSNLKNAILQLGAKIRKQTRELENIISDYVLDAYINKDDGDEEMKITSYPVCKTVVNILDNCFEENNCLSKDEMDLAKSALATFYQLTMIALKHFNVTEVENDSMMDKIGNLFAKLAVRDYQVTLMLLN